MPEAAQENLQLIRSRLEEARRVLVRNALASAAAALFMLAAAWLWAGTLLDYLLAMPAAVRWLLLLAALAAAVVLVRMILVQPLVRYARDLTTARRLEEASAELRDCLTTAVEYGEQPEFRALTSPQIIAALLADVSRRVSGVQVKAALGRYLSSRRRVRWRLLAGVAALALFVVCAWLLPQFFGRGMLRLLLPWLPEPPPSFTVLAAVVPGDAEVVRGSALAVSCRAEGPGSKSALIEYALAAGGAFRRQMAGEREFAYQFQAVMDAFRYRIRVGDARSAWYAVTVYDPPRIEDFTVTVLPPEYAGGKPQQLPAGETRVRAVAGSSLAIGLRANTELGAVDAVYAGDRFAGACTGRESRVQFALKSSGECRIEYKDARAHAGREPLVLSIRVVDDAAPEVAVIEPAKEEAAVARDAEVTIRVAARDDLALSELGFAHNLGYEEQRIVLRRYEPGVAEDEAAHQLRLALKGLKGGEVIAYYGYARDADAIKGPKEARSRLQFLVAYDEERYAGAPMPEQPTEALKALNELIDRQKSAMRETFQAMDVKREQAPLDALAGTEDALAADVRELLNRMAAQPDTMAAAEELEHLEKAADTMLRSADALKRADVKQALSSEGAALKHLSDVRRIVLSGQASSGLEQAAEDMLRERQAQERAARRTADEAATKLPEMLDRHRQLSRELARLDEPETHAGASTQPQMPKPPQPPEEGRHLKKKAEETQQLAGQAAALADRLANAASRSLQQAAQSLNDAHQNYQEAAKALEAAAVPEARRDLDKALEDLQRARAQAAASANDLLERELTRREGEARDIARDAQDAAAAQLPAQQPGLQQRAAELADALAELATTPAAPPQVRQAVAEAAAEARQSARQPAPAGTAASAQQAAERIRDARSGLNAERSQKSAQLADQVQQLAERQQQVAAAADQQEAFRAAQQEIRSDTAEARSQAAALEASRNARHARQALGEALRDQQQALAAQAPQEAQQAATAAAADLTDAADALRRDLGERDAQALLEAARALKQAMAAAERERTAARQAVSPDAQTTHIGAGQPQPAAAQQNERQTPSEQAAQPRQAQPAAAGQAQQPQPVPAQPPAQPQAADGQQRHATEGGNQGTGRQASEHARDAMQALERVINERDMVDRIKGTLEPAAKQPTPAAAKGLAGDLSLREVAHERAFRTGARQEALEALKELAARLETAAGPTAGTDARFPEGKASAPEIPQSLEAATDYLAEALKRLNASDEVVRQLEEARRQLQQAARQPQAAPITGPNLLETGIQRAYSGAVAEIQRLEDARRPVTAEAVEVPEEYREAVKEYFRRLSED